MTDEVQRQLQAYVEYFRDLGVHDFYRRGEAGTLAWPAVNGVGADQSRQLNPANNKRADPNRVESGSDQATPRRSVALEGVAAGLSAPLMVGGDTESGDVERAKVSLSGGAELSSKLVSFDDLAALPESRVAVEHRADALRRIREQIGDCTRCPLAYAGRKTIVFGDGDAAARVMFVGEGPGADEDVSGIPFVGKAGQLLNNMINAMGLKREDVYIANIVKCRPPANRVPEPVEANTCSQFLLRQMDVVQPQVVVALGATAAAYLLGVKQSLMSLRGKWHTCRGAKLVVTYHPAFLLRDPRQKGETWKDLQMVMVELGLKAPAKT